MNVETIGNVFSGAKEEVSMTHNPIIKEWELYFDKDNGYDNRTTVAKAFTDFWEDSTTNKLEIPGKCMLGGEVFGREGFNDGDEIFTSNIKSVERVERGYQNGVPHDLMCATTNSGSKYYFYSDDHNGYMFLMLGDIINAGELSQSSNYYLKREYRGSRLI